MKDEKEKLALDLLQASVKKALASPDIQERITLLQAVLDELPDAQHKLAEGPKESGWRIVQKPSSESLAFEEKLRKLIQLHKVNPSLSSYVGQEAVKCDLRTRLDTAKQQFRSFPHLLLCGPREMGKTTLANALAIEMGKDIKPVDASIIYPGDLAAVLSNLDQGDLILMTDIDCISESILEVFITAVEDFQLQIIIGKGSSARNITLALPRFTLVGTTARPSQVDKRLLRWMMVYDFAPYNVREISEIIRSIAKQENLVIDSEAASLLAEQCEGSPGNAKVIVKRVRDYLNPTACNHVTIDLATQALLSFGYLNKSFVSTDLATKLRNMSALQFEEFVANVYREIGYAVEMTQQSGDHGIDILMRKGDQLIAVQCKRWDAPVGEPVIRDFLGSLMGIKANCGYVVASSTFTSRAFSFAQDKPIKLFDLDALMDLVNQHKRDIP